MALALPIYPRYVELYGFLTGIAMAFNSTEDEDMRQKLNALVRDECEKYQVEI